MSVGVVAEGYPRPMAKSKTSGAVLKPRQKHSTTKLKKRLRGLKKGRRSVV